MRNNIVPRPEQNMDESEGDKQINSDENPNLKEKKRRNLVPSVVKSQKK